MTETGIPAAENDVEALILGDAFATDEDSCITDTAGREVTMRGDLQQMPLADVFQSLGMSKMEGVLRVRNLVEQREIFFRDGVVRSYTSARVEMRRIGVQLVQGGLITPENLRAILFEQKKSRRPLRELLIEHRILPEAEIDELFVHRAAEELYGVFTWTQGSFEFYKGPPSDPVVQARFDELKPFDTNGVLMEVARRSDEWEVILDTIRSVDEIVMPVAGTESRVHGDERDVLRALDGRRTIRMLAPSTLFGLFELSRIVRALLSDRVARFATASEVLAAAQQFLDHDRKKLANALLEMLVARPEKHSYEEMHAIASLFQAAGEQRRAASTLLSAAREAGDPMSALEMLRDARSLAPRSCEVLAELRQILRHRGDSDQDQELRQVTDDLCNALIEEGRLPEGLALLDEIDAEQPGDPRLVFRRAIVLNKLGRRDEAVSGLMALAETFRASRQRDQLAVVYEQVLKIDPRRRDVSRALRALHATRIVRRLRIAAVVVVLVGSGAAGVVSWRSRQRAQLLGSATETVAKLLAQGDVEAAVQAITDTESRVDDDDRIAELRAMIDSFHARRREESERALAAGRRGRLADAASHFERGDLEQAIATYAAMREEFGPAAVAELHDVVRTRFASLLSTLEQLAQNLQYVLPAAPEPTIDAKVRRQALEHLRERFKDDDLRLAGACLRALEHDLCRAALAEDTATRLVKVCSEIVRLFGIADARRTAYLDLEAKAELGRRLNPLVLAASEHEAHHRYQEAAEAYRTLVAEHPHEDGLKAEFRARSARAEQIAQRLAEVTAASDAGDAPRAWQLVRALRTEFPDVPAFSLVAMPLGIDSCPRGASIWIGDERVGTTPAHVKFVPGRATAVRIAHDGYETMTRELTAEEQGDLRVVLVKLPAWTATLAGAITQTPATDGKHRVFAVDRAGRTTALDLDQGRELWSVDSTELSGLLPRPAVFGEFVVVASVDGSVRCLRAADGGLVWQRTGLAVEVSPVARGDVWLAATVDRRLVVLEAATGKPRFEVPLPHVPAGLTVHDRIACCTLTNGEILGIDASDGTVRWRRAIEQVIAAPPTRGAGELFAVGVDGRTGAFEIATGEQRWLHDLDSLGAIPPVVHGDHVLVAGDQEVLVLAAASGAVARRLAVGEPVTSLGAYQKAILVGTEKGNVFAYDTRDWREVVRLRGPGRASAAPLVIGDWIVLGFEGKALHAYHKLQ